MTDLNQEIRNLAAGLSASDKVQLAASLIDQAHAVAVIWTRDDVVNSIENGGFEDARLTDDEIKRLADTAMGTYEFRTLGEPNEANFETIGEAIWSASHDLGIDLNRERCAEDGCENDLDDGEGWDGYCGEHADQREAAGLYDD